MSLHQDVDTELGKKASSTQSFQSRLSSVNEDAESKAVHFSPPQDITSEAISFRPSDDENKSVEGIVDYGKCDVDSIGSSNPALNDGRERRTRRASSLELRKSVPNNILFSRDAIKEDLENKGTSTDKMRRASSFQLHMNGCFHNLFLNPSYPLRRQMMLTFGSVSTLTILLVMIVSIVATVMTGNYVKSEATPNVEEWVDEFMSSTTRYVAQTLSPKIMPTEMVQIMVEVAQDRFAGYPTTKDDSLTPFFDTLSQTNVYPLKNKPLPLDWDFRHTQNETEGNVNNETYAEHVQDRWSKGWYLSHPRLSTVQATYMMQGACDPRANPGEMAYYQNCTDANNDISTGGVLAPTPTNELVHLKGSDLSPFLKALFEYQYIKQFGYYFSNGGAGSSILFPHYELDSLNSYESIGCEWMRELNPIDSSLGPIGTDEEIARCHPDGAVVPTREYNPMERAWCRDQALDPSRVHSIGPYVSAWSGVWLMTTGRAIYDRVTGAFISCIAVDFTIDIVNGIIEEAKIADLGMLTLARNNDKGTVVTSPNFDFESATEPTTINDPNLGTGVDKEMFEEIKSIDWSSAGAQSTPLYETEDKIISVYPIPAIPEVYDPTYRPEFFAIFSVSKSSDLLQKAENINQQVDESVEKIIIFTVAFGLAGLAIMILLILLTSSWFVEPLKWMRHVGDQVVGKFGHEVDTSIDYEWKKTNSCSPNTELNILAEEFNKMVKRFSGGGTAKRVQTFDTDKLNTFDFQDEFAGLYKSRENRSFAFNYQRSETSSRATVNSGHISQMKSSLSEGTAISSPIDITNRKRKVYKSPLFHWMVGLIATPMMVFTAIISAVVLWQLSDKLPSVIVPVKNEFLELQGSYRETKTKILAKQMSNVAEKAARDTHLITRMASWLYFGGIDMPNSFTEVMEGSEDCKGTPAGALCEWTMNVACDCEWNDFSARDKTDACTNFSPGESRYLQRVHFAAQSQDASPDGSRYSTSYPEVATSPNTTAWWDNVTVLPHSTDEPKRIQYSTSYDRVKVVSALSTVFVPLYNYDKSNGKSVGLYVSFEADGMFAGFRGCDTGFVKYPFWQSTEENGAAELRPELCPVGKYGYDARCRGWYHDGKTQSITSNGSLHITSPYVFAEDGTLGQSMTSPLIDPAGKRHIGQVLVDFLPGSMLRPLSSGGQGKLDKGSFAFLVTTEEDVLGHDTVIGPGFSLEQGNDGKNIKELIASEDGRFASILRSMKEGKQGDGTFYATIADTTDKFSVTYAPVHVKSLRPLNSSDIASGVEEQTSIVYSLAFVDAANSNTVADAFQDIEDFTSNTIQICTGILGALIVISTMLIVYIAFRVAASMSEPILQLLDVMKDINSDRISNKNFTDLSDYEGSCCEVDSVYKTMEMLYKVMQFANTAFFSGELEIAYEVLRDALQLFVRLDNKKAIAVASNNLGNTMLTIYRTMESDGIEKMCGLTKTEVIEKGTAYSAHSIKLGEEAYDKFYDEQGWSEECLAFMQFLANRYFNRAVFFLTTSKDHKNPKEAESLGFRDLQITGDMDLEIVDQCVEMGFKINRVERFELMMSRVRGLLGLVKLGYSPDELFIEDQINDVYKDLSNAMKNPSSELFKDVPMAGRMQKLDTELIKYLRDAKGDNTNAARVAVRMFVEDEYLYPEAEQEAVKMLLIYLKKAEDKNCPADEDGLIAEELELVANALELCVSNPERALRRSTASSSGHFVEANKLGSLSLSLQTAVTRGSVTERPENKTGRRSSAKRESMRDDVTMELF